MDIVPAGDHATLVQLDAAIPADALHAAASRVRALPGVLACIVGHSSLYVIGDAKIEASTLSGAGQAGLPVLNETHRIAVAFDGPDLEEFLRHAILGRDEFLHRLAELRLVVRYLGFRGGFAYLDGWPAEWAMPRRPTSRPVARGSFAIAGGVAGFYPIDTPGGWNVLGRTAEPIEYRFKPGDEIRIVVTQALLPVDPRQTRVSVAQTRVSVAHFPGIEAPFVTRVRAANWSDLEHGMPAGGPFDIEAAEAANLAAGKARGDELFEFAQVGPRVTPDSSVVLAWYTASGGRVVRARRDETIDFGRIRDGLRGYLAIGARGDVRELERDNRLVIRTMRGPHDIGGDEIECVVTPSIDRVGIRMRASLGVRPPADMPSIGMQFGTLQLHPDGSVVAMGPDHPVTGGYMQPMTVLWSERWKLAHLAPGERVRFVAG